MKMSNIYHTEPPTCGKVLLHTSFGDIDVELWSKECPKACRNFVQLAMEGVSKEGHFLPAIRRGGVLAKSNRLAVDVGLL